MSSSLGRTTPRAGRFAQSNPAPHHLQHPLTRPRSRRQARSSAARTERWQTKCPHRCWDRRHASKRITFIGLLWSPSKNRMMSRSRDLHSARHHRPPMTLTYRIHRCGERNGRSTRATTHCPCRSQRRVRNLVEVLIKPLQVVVSRPRLLDRRRIALLRRAGP